MLFPSILECQRDHKPCEKLANVVKASVLYSVQGIHALLWMFIPKVPSCYIGGGLGTDLHRTSRLRARVVSPLQPLIFLVCSVGESGVVGERSHTCA